MRGVDPAGGAERVRRAAVEAATRTERATAERATAAARRRGATRGGGRLNFGRGGPVMNYKVR